MQYGNKQLTLGEFFNVSGSCGDDGEMIWEGDCAKIKLIGTGMTTGRMTIRGNAGMHLGAEMTGGEIICEGDAGDWVGAEMHGGRIHVRGNAGHLIGAVYRGGRRGMTGGEILIDGKAGNEIGHTMRRGLIAVGGRSGDAAGFNMIAGSIFLFGEAGIRPGAGMRRGTIAIFRCRRISADVADVQAFFDVQSAVFATLLAAFQGGWLSGSRRMPGLALCPVSRRSSRGGPRRNPGAAGGVIASALSLLN